jgi:hypothetical protein
VLLLGYRKSQVHSFHSKRLEGFVIPQLLPYFGHMLLLIKLARTFSLVNEADLIIRAMSLGLVG